MNFSDFKNSSLVLSNDKMRNVKGGTSGTCGYLMIFDSDYGLESMIKCGVSKDHAQGMFRLGGPGSHWCCDSCGASSYCG